MSFPPLADLEELSARLGITIDAESADGLRALAVIADASSLVRTVAGLTWVDEADSGLLVDPVPDIVIAITLAAALRAYRNPTGAQQASVGDVSVSFGGGSSSRRFESVYLTRTEERQLRTLGGLSSAGAVGLTTDLFTGADLLWAPTQGDEIPLGPIPWEDA